MVALSNPGKCIVIKISLSTLIPYLPLPFLHLFLVNKQGCVDGVNNCPAALLSMNSW